MNRTAYDWHDLAKLFMPVCHRPNGLCEWDKDKNLICYYPIDGSKIQFPSRTKALSKEILNSLPLQFALLCSAIYESTSEHIVMSEMFETDGFEHVISVLLKCYNYVAPNFKDGKLYTIRVTSIQPYTKKVFKQLLLSQKLHPCILFLASRAVPAPNIEYPSTLYEIHKPDCNQSVASDEVREFAAFLKTRSELIGDMITIPFYGYSFEEFSQNATINSILSQFSRSFYVAEADTNRSRGFYLI